MKSIIKKYIGSILGTERHQEEIDTLFYFLNQYVDITKLPPATGALRELQLLDAKFLKVIDLVLQRNNLTYCLACGTLLGGIRHKGAIPWDDDVDLFMPRDVFDRAKKILPAECEKLHFAFYDEPSRWMDSMGIGFDCGAWLDIFPLECLWASDDYDKVKEEYKKMCKCIVKFDKSKILLEKYHEDINNLLIHTVPSGTKKYFYTTFAKMIFREEDFYPIQKGLYEDYQVMYPNNSDVILKAQYGDYMHFPYSGIAHHGTVQCVKANSVLQKRNNELDKLIATLSKDLL